MKRFSLCCLLFLVLGAPLWAVTLPENRVIYAGGMWYEYNRDAGAANWGDMVIDKTGGFGGVAGDKPYLADINGDGLDDRIVVRLENGGVSFYGNYTAADGSFSSPVVVGGAGGSAAQDTVVFGGDINNDRIDDPILVRKAANGSLKWGVLQSTGPGFASTGAWGTLAAFGINTDLGLAGDLNGDGIVDRVLARAENGGWTLYADYSVAGAWGDAVADVSRGFGDSSTDTVSLSDINGDGKDDVVVMRKNADYSISLFGFYTLADGTLGNAAPDIAYTGGDWRMHEWVFGQTEVPEPATVCMLAFGAMAMLKRKK